MSSRDHVIDATAEAAEAGTSCQNTSEYGDHSMEMMVVGEFGVRAQQTDPMMQPQPSGRCRSLEPLRTSPGAGATHHHENARGREMRRSGGVTRVPGRVVATLQRKFWDSNKVKYL